MALFSCRIELTEVVQLLWFINQTTQGRRLQYDGHNFHFLWIENISPQVSIEGTIGSCHYFQIPIKIQGMNLDSPRNTSDIAALGRTTIFAITSSNFLCCRSHKLQRKKISCCLVENQQLEVQSSINTSALSPKKGSL